MSIRVLSAFAVRYHPFFRSHKLTIKSLNFQLPIPNSPIPQLSIPQLSITQLPIPQLSIANYQNVQYLSIDRPP